MADENIIELKAIAALSTTVSASLSLSRTIEAALSGIKDALNPDLGFIFLKQGEKLIIQGILPALAPGSSVVFPEHRVGECLCGLAARDGFPVYVEDIRCDPRCTWDECKQAGIRSFAAIPLRNGIEVIGVLGLGAYMERNFKARSGFIETMANQVSMALNRATLYEAVQTELKEREKSEKRFRSLSEGSPLGIHFYCLEKDNRLVFTGANPAADTILGIDNAMFIGKTIEEAFPPLIHTEIPAKYREVISSGHMWEADRMEYDHEGIKGAFHVIAFRIEPGHMAVMFNEITEKKRTEEIIRLNEARLEGLLRIHERSDEGIRELLDFALNEAIVLTGSRTGYIFSYDDSEKELSLLTWSKDAAQQCAVFGSKTVYALDTTGLWGEAVRQSKPIMINNYLAPHPFKKGLPDGHMPIHRFLTIPVFNEGRIDAVVGVANKETDYNLADIRQLTLMMDAVWKTVQRKRATQEKQLLEAQLLQSQKLEAIGALAGGIAHDFNNMMGVILGQVELGLSDMDPGNPVYTTLKDIEKAAMRSAELTRQLLAFARKQTVALKVLDLNQTLSGMIRMLQRLIGEDIDLSFKPGENLWPVLIDPSQIDQILANLCVNARDAITEHGQVTIETRNMVFDEDHCASYPGYFLGEYVMLAVSDNGQGMNKEILGHIFEPFFTTKGLGKGTGLGLSTVYGIVRQNDGFIRTESQPMHGSTFSIYLPRYGEPADKIPKKEIDASLGSGSETILIVEDEPMILEIASAMLKRNGYDVLVAGTPGEAIRIAKEHDQHIHLLITDVVMPEMNGHTLAKTLLSVYPDMKCLFMSGYTANIIEQHGVLEDGVNFIEKPFSMKDLILSVRNALGAGDRLIF